MKQFEVIGDQTQKESQRVVEITESVPTKKKVAIQAIREQIQQNKDEIKQLKSQITAWRALIQEIKDKTGLCANETEDE